MATTTYVNPSPALTKGFALVQPRSDVKVMTLQGTVDKTLFLTLLVVTGGVAGWMSVESVGIWPLWLASIGSIAVGLFTIFKPQIASKTAPLYSLLQGLLLGAISMVFNDAYPGIVLTAIVLTVGILVALLAIYSTGIIKVTQRFRMGVAAATFGVFAVYLVNLIASLFGSGLGFVYDASPVGIGFSLLVICIACANLIVDFDFVQRGVASQFPKYMEWYAAFSIMVTLIWLYIEILRLLAKLRR